METNWTYEEFSTFAMLYAASVNADVEPDDLHLIRQRVDENTFDKMKSVFDQCSDIKCIDILRAYHDRYMADEASRQRLLNDVKILFEADDRYTNFERELVRMFRMVL
ncbi:MAG: hypothetical protein H6557_06285 [Lewinellaceae bacterium]|nr:hypothetical protein [Phaeodactylibacter sp.]MCB9036214.1 hypothetical protein [Lewinellaceae bacterium]